jgi:arsenate reductase
MKVYGIKNCNTVKKALNWLDEKGISYEFHDYKKLGIAKETLQSWEKQVGWPALINKKGTTWRTLTPQQQEIENSSQAIHLMQEKTSVIKRPLIEGPNGILLGFDSGAYDAYFKS